MWPVLAAAVAAGGEVPAVTYVAGGLALVSAVSVAYIGLAGTWRTSTVQRAANLDKRLDDRLTTVEARNTALEERLAELAGKLFRALERYERLRRGVIRAGLNPDELEGKGADDDPSG